ncbi:hypothetical protein J1N35_029431 [Gossypium stocksii]|uniref:Uncharacterized protein n=1 Tax=Gossypium stocksii TaxID=47602 RepID=A0A9D3V019_9ROSI|nr:hypothetical protein J1N35_029431 [Gossypium stocksii]
MVVTVTTIITNDAGQDLKLRSSSHGSPPDPIKNTATATFLQTLPTNYVNGAFVYKVNDTFSWIVFWTPDDQVFTKLFKISDPIPREQAASNPRQGHSEDEIIYAGYKYTV